MIPIRDHWVAATPGSNNEGSVFYDWGLYPSRSVPGWIGACMPWYIYCPVTWAIMCKYCLSRGQPCMQGLSWGQPGQVSNVNNEFNCVTAVSVDTRGIWLCSAEQQGKGIRKDPSMCTMKSGRAQKPEEQLDTKLSPTGSPQLSPLLCPFAEDSTKSS